jgi:hypothetical protein
MHRILLCGAVLLAVGTTAARGGVYSPSWWVDDLQLLYGIEVPGVEKLPVSERTGPRLYSVTPVPFSDVAGPYMIGNADGTREYGYVEPAHWDGYPAATNDLASGVVETVAVVSDLGDLVEPEGPGDLVEPDDAGDPSSGSTVSTGLTLTSGTIMQHDTTATATEDGTPAVSTTTAWATSTGIMSGSTATFRFEPGGLQIAYTPPTLDLDPPVWNERTDLAHIAPEPSTLLLAAVAAMAGAWLAFSRRRR